MNEKNEISKPADPVVPAAGKSTLKLKTPVPKVKVKVKDTWVPRVNRTASGLRIKEWFMPAASIVIIIAGVILGYLRFVNGMDVFKPVRNRIALAYYALAGKGNYTLIDKNELNDLMAAAEKPEVTVVTQETYIVQADGSVKKSKDTGAEEGEEMPEADAMPAVPYDRKEKTPIEIGRDTTNKEEAATSSFVQHERTLTGEEQKSNLVQNISGPQASSGAAVETQAGDQRLDALMKRTQKEDPAAYLELADYYYNSIDERAHAFEWYQRAAKYGLPRALLRYGDCLLAGLGTEKNELKAVEAYKKAAGKNYAEAQYRLGECCLTGAGVAINKPAAFSWFIKAAVTGYKPAIEKVAECYEKGIGVEKNLRHAKQWRARLSKSGL